MASENPFTPKTKINTTINAVTCRVKRLIIHAPFNFKSTPILLYHTDKAVHSPNYSV